ncbi:hypothetical protein [Acetilactobacillus jinshanensis]|nr:hypothetical protein [Acetilactobacillus jinshanensis]
MMSLITKMMKHSRYDTKAKDYYLTKVRGHQRKRFLAKTSKGF